MTWYSPAQLTMQLDDCDGPVDVIDALALGPFLSGAQPWARSLRLHRVRPDASLLPEGEEPSRTASDTERDAVLAHGDGWTLRVVRWRDQTAEVVVSATSEELGRSVLARATDGSVEPAPNDDTDVTMGFWHLGARRPERRARSIAVTPWPDLRRNYTRRAMAAFERLTGLDPAAATGRLLLLHGPPGTGKTTALRALAHAWRPWCRFDYVLDPERLFRESGYLMSVTLGEDDDEPEEEGRRRWRLLILEDCDELIRSDAKQGTGQSLARLLNITDGLLGQGLDLLVAITTNEPIGRLHPAVTRPGRCLAQVEVGRLTPAEARAWLGAPAVGPEGATLAELFALRGDLHVVADGESVAAVGQYL